MFSGIVEAAVTVRAFKAAGEGARLILPRPEDLPGGSFEADLGDSISVSGCCLTVAAFEPDGGLVFDLSAETLARTWFSDDLGAGRRVNLERSVTLEDRLGGHLVSGHVDGGATLIDVAEAGDGGRVLTFEVDTGLERYLLDKGSVCLDGVSLTVVEPDERRFCVAVIPTTLAVTSLGSAATDDRVNFEADLVGKWVERLLVEAGRL